MIELAQNPSKVTDEFRIKVMQRLGLFPTGKTMLQDFTDGLRSGIIESIRKMVNQ